MLYMEITFIGKDDHGRKINLGAIMDSDKETRASFESVRPREVPIDTCQFLLDLKDDHDIIDTIGINADTVEFLTGKPVLSAEEYDKIDKDYWAMAMEICKAGAA